MTGTSPNPRQRTPTWAPELEDILNHNVIHAPPRFKVPEIRCETVWVTMRDDVRLATDVYLPPICPAPAVAMRTPYGRSKDAFVGYFLSFARRGYVVISQDCRGTGDSEPESFDYYMYELDDGYDLVEWANKQEWFDGFIGALGGSYVGQTQWCMATHPRMSTIVPLVSGLGLATNTTRLYMFRNALAHSVGKGAGKVAADSTRVERLFEKETLAGGYFNEPLHVPFSKALLDRFPNLVELPPAAAERWLWEHYCKLSGALRAELVKRAIGVKSISGMDLGALSSIFGHQVNVDAHTIPHANPSEMCRLLHAPALMLTGWYDWCLNDAFATWELLRREARESVRLRTRLVIGPRAHAAPGYHEGAEKHPELRNAHLTNVQLLLRWYEAVREGDTDSWPRVIYYLMGANEWRTASDWPVPKTKQMALYLGDSGTLTTHAPGLSSQPDGYTYDPHNPTPTVGGSIVSYVYPPGSVDVRTVQQRPDVLVFRTEPLEHDLDVVGPLRMILYASSSAIDTDFVARVSDVFPDGRAIQLQSGILRARYRNPEGGPELLEPGRIYRLEIDLWATANRFKSGHRLCVDISSADFPRFDRNSNRGGEPGEPISARQAIYHDSEHPSHLLISILGNDAASGNESTSK